VNRRELLVSTGTAWTLGLAGCLGDGEADGAADGTEPSTTGPAAIAESFYEKFDDGDAEAINADIHEDGELSPMSQENADELAAATYRVESAETVEQTQEAATVAVRLTVAGDEESGTVTNRVELRRSGGEWKIWSIGDRSSSSVGPQVSFAVDRRDGDLEITHEAGDEVSADALHVRGDGLEATGSWTDLDGEVSGDDGTVVAGDSLTVGAGKSYELSIVWESPDGDGSVTLHSEGVAVETERATANQNASQESAE